MKKRKSKIIWKIILNVIMLLSLTGCETSCTDQTQEALIAQNNSQVTVEVMVISMDNFTVGPLLIPPNNEEKMELKGFAYTVQVRPIDEWLTYAHAKREELKHAYINAGANNEDVSQILADLADINQKIKSYQTAATTKSCQGMAFPVPDIGLKEIPVRGTVPVVDGEVVHSIRITCVNPPPAGQ
jgi:hypothetical protein